MENGSKFYMVKKKALPEILLKVAEANVLLNRGKAKTIKEAIDAVGISRSSYYKYKDEVFLPEENEQGHKAVLSIVLAHQEGCLSRILTMLSDMHANILTISQTMPLAGKANVLLCIETQDLSLSLNQAIKKMTKVKGVQNIQLLNIE